MLNAYRSGTALSYACINLHVTVLLNQAPYVNEMVQKSSFLFSLFQNVHELKLCKSFKFGVAHLPDQIEIRTIFNFIHRCLKLLLGMRHFQFCQF